MKWVTDRTGRFARRPHYQPEELDQECEQIILAFLKANYGKIEFPIKTDDLTVLIEQKASLDSYADLTAEPGDVEGVTEFFRGKRPVVRIASSLSAAHLENRLRTTLTHEFGHVHFHQFLFEADAQPQSLFDTAHDTHDGNKCKRENMVNAAESDWMEWQAGYVCGSILMPAGALLDTAQTFRANNHLPFSNLTVDSDEGQRLITVVASTFQTSKDAARVRLLKKAILTDAGKARPQELF
jgi:hypothetical protein